MNHLPNSPDRQLSHVPGGSPAERVFDQLQRVHRCTRPPMCARCITATDYLAGKLAAMVLR